jgi:hypothetical protein
MSSLGSGFGDRGPGSTVRGSLASPTITAATEIAFDLNHASPVDGALHIQCNKVVRAMARASQGAFTTQTVVTRMCGDDWFNYRVICPYSWLS